MERFYETKDRFTNSLSVLGAKFVACIILIEHLLQGVVYGGGAGGIIGIPIVFMLKSYGTLTASRIQILMTIAVSPWALKPIFGIVSDCLYIGGYNKIPYIITTTLLAIMSCFWISFTWPLSPTLDTVLYFFLFLQMALADLLIEAKYTEKTALLKEHKGLKNDLVTFNHTGVSIGQLLSIVIMGLLIDVVPLQFFYLLPIVPFIITLYPVYQNWLEDIEFDPLTDDRVLKNVFCGSWFWYSRKDDPQERRIPLVGLDLVKIRQNWQMMLLGMIIVFITAMSILLGMIGVDSLYLFIFSILSSLLLIGAFLWLTERSIALIQIYVIIQNMCSVSLESAVFFFFTDSPGAYPEGPHFSNFFYITVIGLVATVISVLGMFFYTFYTTDWTFRGILMGTNLIFIIVSLPNIILFQRWNLLLGIPDGLFVIGTEVLQKIIGSWAYAAMSVIMLKVCPKGVAATSYALMAGCANLGSGLAQFQGAFLLDILSIKPMGLSGESAQFENLWIASLISIALSVIPILFIPWLVPEGRPSDEDDVEVVEEEENTIVINEEEKGEE